MTGGWHIYGTLTNYMMLIKRRSWNLFALHVSVTSKYRILFKGSADVFFKLSVNIVE